MTFEQMATEYLESSKFLSLEKQTKAMYATHARRLITLGGRLPIVDATHTHMPIAVARSRNRVGNLSSEWFKRIDKGCESNVLKLAARTALSIIYKWGIVHGYLMPSQSPVPYIDRQAWKHEVAEKHPYTLEEIDMIEANANSGRIPEDLIPYAYFVVVLFDLGSRPEEMYEHHNNWFTKRDGDNCFDVHGAKGKARREFSRHVVMGKRTIRLMNWFRSQPSAIGCEKFTFRTNKGNRFHQATVCKRVKEICALIGIEERALYNTRRGLATAMLKSGQSIFDVANRLGNTPEVVRKNYAVMGEIDKARSGIPSFQK